MSIVPLSANPTPPSAPAAENTSQSFAKLAVESIELINKIADLLSSNERSLAVEIRNYTSYRLIVGEHYFEHGGFTEWFPANEIPPFQPIMFGVSSNGLATGVNGEIDYTIDEGGLITFKFDNPFVGTNAQSVHPDGAADARVSIIGNISDGNNGHVRFEIYDKLGIGALQQKAWRACSKCKQFFYDGFVHFKGACPAGGGHDASGSYKYDAIYNANTSSNLQNDWRSCKKCLSLYYAPIPGPCAGGGSHSNDDSWSYGVMHNTTPFTRRQGDWRSCNKCRTLYFGPQRGVCAGGGAHSSGDSFNYSLDYDF
jgi:hypothetical protein